MSYKNFENLSDAAVGAELAQPEYRVVSGVRNEDGSVIVANRNMQLFDLDKFADGNRRKTGRFTTHSVANFISFVKDETTPEHCKIFVDAEAMKATAFLNYGADGYAQGKLDYNAIIALKQTPVFAKLVQLHQHTMSQRDFIDFLTDYSPVFEAINTKDEKISIGMAVHQLRQVKIDETKNTSNEVENFGETRSTFENVKARTADDNMPVAFVVNDACYQSLPKIDISLRLIIKSDDGKPYFKLIINALDLLQLERADTFVKMVNDDLAGEFDVMLGSFTA